jgi:hypothetical protein
MPDLSHLISPSPWVSTLVLVDEGLEAAVLDRRTGDHHRLNPAATAVWLLLDEPTSAEDIVADLVDAAGLSKAEATTLTLTTIEQLRHLDLLDRAGGPGDAAASSSSVHDLLPPPPGAPDAERLLPREPDPCGSDLHTLPWGTLLTVDIAGWIVGIRPDSEATGDELRSLLAAHLVDTTVPVRANFSLRRPVGRLRRRPGELYVAGELVRRSTKSDELVGALLGRLAGLAALSEPLPFEGIAAAHHTRLFRMGNRAVIARCSPAWLTDDDALPAGLIEAPTWSPRIDLRRRVVLPTPPLVAHATGPTHDELDLAGVVVLADGEGRADITPMWAGSGGDLDAWGLVLADLQQGGQVHTVSGPDDLAASLTVLLRG